MEKSEDNSVSAWVDARMETLAPPQGWIPDRERGLQRLRDGQRREAPQRRSWIWASAAAAAVCLVALALPAPRALAQRLWERLFIGRIEVVRFELDEEAGKVLRAEIVNAPGQPSLVRDAGEASRLAGFLPRLPAAGVLRDSPRLSVIGPITAQLRISNQELEAALRRAGAAEIEVPRNWEGARFAVRVSPMVIADYPDVSVLQSVPIALDLPSGFELSRFLEVAFRILRVEPREARYLSEKFAANPAWFLGIPQDENVEIREVRIGSGQGMLMEDFDQTGASERVAVVWNVPDRIYAVSGKVSHELALAVANSIR
jgi:hypothetical protein